MYRVTMKYQRLLAILLVMGLLFAVLPMGAVKAQALDVCAEGCSYTTIQAAVDAAANGDTITVGPGTYVEQVVITKNLSLIGVGAPTIQAYDNMPVCFTRADSGVAYRSIVCAKDADVNFDGFTIDGAGKGGTNSGFMGIVYNNAGGTIKNNTVTRVRYTPFNGVQNLIGVYAYNNTASGKVINLLDNTITDYQKNAITLNGTSVDLTVNVDGNTINGQGCTPITAQNGIQINGLSTHGVISNNTIRDVCYDGANWVASSILNYSNVNILNNTITGGHMGIYSINSSSLISGNTLEIIEGATYAYGIEATANYGSLSNDSEPVHIEIADNHITFVDTEADGAYFFGMDVYQGNTDVDRFSSVDIHDNTISGFNYGLSIYSEDEGLVEVTVKSNKIDSVLSDLEIGGAIEESALISIEKNDIRTITNSLPFEIDASPNWFGTASGPAEGSIDGSVNVSPWCGEPSCAVSTSIPGVIEIPAGTYNIPGGFLLDQPGLTVRMAPGAIIQNNSPCFIVTADNITLEGGICVPTGGSNGIDVADGVDYLIVQGMEIDGATSGGTANGIAFTGDHKNVQILDNYFHDLGGVAIDFGTGAYTEYFEVQGNYLKGEIMARDGSTLDVTYNNWDLPAGPGTLANLTTVPFTYAGVSVAPTTDKMLVGDELTYSIQLDPRKVTGTELDLVYDPAVVSVKSVTCNDGDFDLRCVVDTSTPGVIHFSGVSYTAKDSLTNLYTVVFTGAADGTSALDADETDALFAMFSGGSSTKVYANVFSDGVVTVYAHGTVTGAVQLQGRPAVKWTDAVVELTDGVNGYAPYTFAPSAAWGAVSQSRVVFDTYTLGITRTNYLPVVGKSLTVDGVNVSLAAVKLLGGDVVADAGNAINPADAALVGTQYGTADTADINGDGMVDLYDLTILGGNYGATSATAY